MNPNQQVARRNLATFGQVGLLTLSFLVCVPLLFRPDTARYYVPGGILVTVAALATDRRRMWTPRFGMWLSRSSFPFAKVAVAALAAGYIAYAIVLPTAAVVTAILIAPFAIGIFLFWRYDRRRQARQSSGHARLGNISATADRVASSSSSSAWPCCWPSSTSPSGHGCRRNRRREPSPQPPSSLHRRWAASPSPSYTIAVHGSARRTVRQNLPDHGSADPSASRRPDPRRMRPRLPSWRYPAIAMAPSTTRWLSTTRHGRPALRPVPADGARLRQRRTYTPWDGVVSRRRAVGKAS